MSELRSVDPRSLVPNPNNPRRTPAAAAMDEQLVASIKAIGLIQPPPGQGRGRQDRHRRRQPPHQAAIAAGLAIIDVVVGDADGATDAMRAVSENLIRRGHEQRRHLARHPIPGRGRGGPRRRSPTRSPLPVRTIKRLKLLAHLPPAMLDVMAAGNMPTEHDLRTPSRRRRARTRPRPGRSTSRRKASRSTGTRSPAPCPSGAFPIADAKFDADLAKAYGVVWEDGPVHARGRGWALHHQRRRLLRRPTGMAAEPPAGTRHPLPVGEHGSVQLPRKAEHVYGKPAKGDVTGHYLDAYSGKVKSVTYRLPPPKAAAPGKNGGSGDTGADEEPAKPARPEVTQRGQAMIGDLRTNALHEGLKTAALDETTLIGLLVLALGANNVSVERPGSFARRDPRQPIAYQLIEGGKLTRDPETVAAAARAMLATVLSCRENSSKSGLVARVAGDAIGAGQHLPNMATEDFLSCLSKPGIEKAALAAGVRVEVRARDTRARIIERFRAGHYVHPGTLFELGAAEITECRIKADMVAGADDEERLDPADGEGDVDAASDESGEGSEPYADAAD